MAKTSFLRQGRRPRWSCFACLRTWAPETFTSTSLQVFGKYVRGVHAKDGLYPTDGKELGREVKVGTGMVNFPALLKGLHELGYDGSLTIEREIDGPQQIADIAETKEYLSQLIAAL